MERVAQPSSARVSFRSVGYSLRYVSWIQAARWLTCRDGFDLIIPNWSARSRRELDRPGREFAHR